MRNFKFLIVLFFAISLTFIGCKKYNDGPRISFMPKKYRVANKWKIDRKFENSVEVTRSADWENETYEFKSNGGYFYTNVLGITSQGTWDLENTKENLVIFTSSSTVYKILRLKNKELWLEDTNIPGIETETHYVPK
ncbi:MAG: hypothetical protein WC223_08110 [Bacteroidales bacterium]|jgi:hypothetical protein